MITWELLELNFIILFNYSVLMFLNLPSRDCCWESFPHTLHPNTARPPLWRSKRPITVTSLPKLFNTATQITKVTVSSKAGISLFFFCGRQKFNKCGRFVHTRAGGGGELGEFNMYKSGGWRNVFYKRVLQEAISHPSSAEGKLLKRFWEPFKKEKMEFHLGENVTLYCSGFW